MANPEREAHIRPPVFDGNNFTHWKIRTTAYLQSLGAEVWGIVEGGYKFPSATPTDPAEKKQYELNAKAVTVLLSSLTQSEFMKIMHFKSAKEIWDKIVTSYEGDDQVKRAKLQTLRIRYETLKMHNNESVANYFLRMDEIVNCMRDLGEEFEEIVLVEKVLRSLSAKFDSKVSAIEEKENVQKITMSQLHGILTAFEMRQEVPPEAAFEVSEEEEEVNFVKNLERGTGRFKGKLPFKCFLCGRVGHYATRCPHNKGKKFEEDGRSYYTHITSSFNDSEDIKSLMARKNKNASSNNGEDIKNIMAHEKKNAETEEVAKLKEQLETETRVREQLQDIAKDQSTTIQRLESKILSLKEDLENQEHEIIKLKRQVEKGRKAEEDLRNQYLIEKEQHQVEVNILNGKIEEKDKLLRFQDSTKILDDILNSQRSPAIKTGLGFHEYVEGESSSQGEARNSNEKSEMLNKEQPRKEIPQRKSFTPNYGRDRQLFPPLNNVECYVCHNLGHVAARCRSRMVRERSSHPRYFRGYCFACNAYGHKAIDCDRRNMRNVRCYTCNNYGHKARECRSRFQNSKQEDHTSSQFQKLKKTETEKYGITQSADITDTGESESDEFQYSLHTLI